MGNRSGSHSRPLDFDAETGITRTWHWDADTQTATIQTTQRVDDLLDLNKTRFNEGADAMRGEMVPVASIPLNIYWQLKREGVIDDPKRLKAWLNDSENRYFRTAPGRV